MLGYKNRSFEYASLINSGVLVFFMLIFDQEVYFSRFSRISDGHPYPFYPEVPPPPPGNGYIAVTVTECEHHFTVLSVVTAATALSVATTVTALSVVTAVTLVCTVVLQRCHCHRCYRVVNLHRWHTNVALRAHPILFLTRNNYRPTCTPIWTVLTPFLIVFHVNTSI